MPFRRPLAIAAACLASFVAAFAQQQPAAPPATGTGLLMGVVVEFDSDRPVAGAVVTMAELIRPVRTDTQGRFVLADLPKGTFTLNVERTGYAAGAFGRRRPGGQGQPLVLADGERVTDLKIPIWKLGSISGVVTDDIGEPMIEVLVTSLRRTTIAGRRKLVAGPRATTDDRGQYRIGGLVPGEYSITVASTQTTAPESVVTPYVQTMGSRGGPVDQRMAYQSVGAAASLDLLMRSGGFDVRGLVFQSAAGPVRSGVPTPQPSADGRIFVHPTQYHSSASLPSQATPVAIRSGEDRVGVDLQLKLVPTSRVSGTVLGPDGPASMGLALVPDGDDLATYTNFETALTVSDSTGRFTFLGVPPGSYVLRSMKTPPGQMRGAPPLMAPSGPAYFASQPVTVDAADVTGLSVTLRNGFQVIGSLEFDDAAARPAADVVRRIAVTFESPNGAPVPIQVARGVTDMEARFASYQLAPGAYLVRANGLPSGWMLKSAMLNGQDISDIPLKLERDVSGLTITFTNKPSAVTGRVLDTSGAADAKATVLVFPSAQALWADYGETPGRLRSVRVDRDGTFKINGLPPGDYLVAAVLDEAAADWPDARLLQAVARSATAIKLADSESRSLDLRTAVLR